MKKKGQVELVVIFFIATILLFFAIWVGTRDQEYWDLRQRSVAFICKVKGGHYLTLGPVGCCADREYYNTQRQSCIDSGGNWIIPPTATGEDTCWECSRCFCSEGTQWICPVGYPCAICKCEREY